MGLVGLVGLQGGVDGPPRAAAEVPVEVGRAAAGLPIGIGRERKRAAWPPRAPTDPQRRIAKGIQHSTRTQAHNLPQGLLPPSKASRKHQFTQKIYLVYILGSAESKTDMVVSIALAAIAVGGHVATGPHRGKARGRRFFIAVEGWPEKQEGFTMGPS